MDATLLLATNALILGFRHGIDWDHIAAITDIVGSTTATTTGIGTVTTTTTTTHSGRWSDDPSNPTVVPAETTKLTAIRLSGLYALGHAVVVSLLGIAALLFATLLPSWVDSVMERVVGITLLFLSGCIFYSLLQQKQGQRKLESRWMIAIRVFSSGLSKFRNHFHKPVSTDAQKDTEQRKHQRQSAPVIQQYGSRTAFSIGILHGIGAETGSQVLLLGAMGNSANSHEGLVMLVAFVAGLLFSNLTVSILSTAGFLTSRKSTVAFNCISLITAIFSLVIGTIFALGQGQLLPDLQKLISN